MLSEIIWNMPWEVSILEWFASIQNPAMNAIMKFLSLIGYAGLIWIAMTVVMLFFKQTRKMAISMIFALMLSVIFTNLIIKNAVGRVRPYVVNDGLSLIVKAATDASFPSGHTTASFAAAVAFFMHRKKAGIPMLILAALIGISRLYVNIHYPTDVIIGVVLGILYGLGGWLINTKLFFPKVKRFKIFANASDI